MKNKSLALILLASLTAGAAYLFFKGLGPSKNSKTPKNPKKHLGRALRKITHKAKEMAV